MTFTTRRLGCSKTSMSTSRSEVVDSHEARAGSDRRGAGAGCYKLIATSRTSRPKVHELYQRLGFENHGVEFRMNFDDA